MQTNYVNFSIEHIPDNECMYFTLIQNIVHSIDDCSYISIVRNPNSYIVRISMNKAGRTNDLIKQINYFNNACSIIAEYGKSLKAGNLFFKISLSDNTLSLQKTIKK
jgi:hypothetical protein